MGSPRAGSAGRRRRQLCFCAAVTMLVLGVGHVARSDLDFVYSTQSEPRMHHSIGLFTLEELRDSNK